MHSTQKKLAIYITAIVSLGYHGLALSEEPNETEYIEEVIVEGSYILNDRIDTATGLGLTLQETPQSVSVFTAQQIFDQNLDTIADVAARATGVSVNEIDDVRNTFNARGFEINNYQVDGVPLAYTLAGGAGETMLDAVIYERVEIVRGATGLLTGVGDPSASINLVRKKANQSELTGYVNAGVGQWNKIELTADLGGAINNDNTVRGRVITKYQEGESHVNLFEDQKLVFYGVVEADLSDRTTLTTGASHQKETPTAPAWGALPSLYKDGTFSVWPRSQTSSANWSYWDTTNQNIFVDLTHELSNGWQLRTSYNWLKNAQQTKILYLSIDSLETPSGVDQETGLGLISFPFSDDGNNTQNSLDIQLKGSYGLFNNQHEFVLGALYSEQKYVNDTYDALTFPAVGDYNAIQDGSFPYPGFSGEAIRKVDMDTKQNGLYAATRLNFTDSLKAIVGGRISNWNQQGVNYSPPPPFDFGDDNTFVPYMGILYDLTRNHTAYVSYTEIFQPQNTQSSPGVYLDPLTGTSSEIGFKSAFLDGALQTSLAIFQIQQENLAEGTGVFIPGTITELSRAIEGTTSKGYELEIVGRPAENWNIIFGYSDFDATDKNGTDVNTDHPRQLANLFTTYDFSGILDGFVIGGGVNWQSEIYAAPSTTGLPFRMQQDAYSLLALMARYEFNNNLSIQANINNLTDETYFSQVGFYQQYRYGKPRNSSLSLNYTF